MKTNIENRLVEIAARLDAWRDGERLAQVSAEQRGDRHAAEGHYNTVCNYSKMHYELLEIVADVANERLAEGS